jgi:hypothetical protein
MMQGMFYLLLKAHFQVDLVMIEIYFFFLLEVLAHNYFHYFGLLSFANLVHFHRFYTHQQAQQDLSSTI